MFVAPSIACILISARLDQVYMPSGASEAGESEPDMYPPRQWAVTTDPANEVLRGIYIGVRRGAASCRPSRAACSVLRARSCAARTSANTHGFSTTHVPPRLDGYRTRSCQVLLSPCPHEQSPRRAVLRP